MTSSLHQEVGHEQDQAVSHQQTEPPWPWGSCLNADFDGLGGVGLGVTTSHPHPNNTGAAGLQPYCLGSTSHPLFLK